MKIIIDKVEDAEIGRKTPNEFWITKLQDSSTGKPTSNPQTCCNILASAFQSKIERLQKKITVKDPMSDGITPKFDDNHLPAPQFEKDHIFEVIKSVKSTGTPGPDGIHLRHIRDGAEQLAPVLKVLFD